MYIYAIKCNKIIVSIHTGLVVHTAVLPDTHPGIGSVFGIGRYPEPWYRYREGKNGIRTSLITINNYNIINNKLG